MRTPPLPRPSRAALRRWPLHRVVRDLPETLPVLRKAGVDLAARGGRPLAEHPGADRLAAACLEAAAWRPEVEG